MVSQKIIRNDSIFVDIPLVEANQGPNFRLKIDWSLLSTLGLGFVGQAAFLLQADPWVWPLNQTACNDGSV